MRITRVGKTRLPASEHEMSSEDTSGTRTDSKALSGPFNVPTWLTIWCLSPDMQLCSSHAHRFDMPAHAMNNTYLPAQHAMLVNNARVDQFEGRTGREREKIRSRSLDSLTNRDGSQYRSLRPPMICFVKGQYSFLLCQTRCLLLLLGKKSKPQQQPRPWLTDGSL